MRTKTLLIAAAALVAATVSSEAQVYSANVVGYINVAVPANTYVMCSTPFTTGNDILSNILNTATGIPAAGTQVYVWNAAGAKFRTINYNGSDWLQGAGNQDGLAFGPGTGYFLYNATTAFTNTYVGTVLPNVGSSVTNALTTTVVQTGSLIPYGDSVTNPATINLQVPVGTQLNLWNVTKQKYNLFVYQGANSWTLGANNTNPVVNAAQGFFIQCTSGTNWVQTLP